jgi:hypothetical protein
VITNMFIFYTFNYPPSKHDSHAEEVWKSQQSLINYHNYVHWWCVSPLAAVGSFISPNLVSESSPACLLPEFMFYSVLLFLLPQSDGNGLIRESVTARPELNTEKCCSLACCTLQYNYLYCIGHYIALHIVWLFSHCTLLHVLNLGH